MRKKRQRKERQGGSRGWRGEREYAGADTRRMCVAESRTDKEKARERERERERHESSLRYALMCVSARVFVFGVRG